MSSPNSEVKREPEEHNPNFQNRGMPFRRGRGNFRNDPMRGNRRRGPMPDRSNGPEGEDGRVWFNDRMFEKLAALNGPTFELPPINQEERKFSVRTRLYVGNLSTETQEDDLRELFEKFGELGEVFFNREKNFAFLKLDYVENAEKAKKELDGQLLKGKTLKIRFAPIDSAIKVKNLNTCVSNELLYHAFSIFGDVEKALVLLDDRGRPTGEGIVEFAKKGSAIQAKRSCTERCFFLTNSLKPVIVDDYEHLNDVDGYPEKSQQKRTAEYKREREVGPRFAELNSFEEEYGKRWKQMYELYNQKVQKLKTDLMLEIEKLGAQMEFVKYEHETAVLRDQLRQRELDRNRQKQEWEMKQRMMEEQRRRQEEDLRRKEEHLQQNMMQQEEEIRRRTQENNLFMQAHQLTSMLDQQEQNFSGNNTQKPPPPPFLMQNTSNMPNQNNWMNNQGGRNFGSGGGGGAWNKKDNFQQKRRRF